MAIGIIKIMIYTMSILIAGFVLAVGVKGSTGLIGADLDIITEQTTRAVVSIIVNIATVEQGVRHFDLKKNYAYELNETHLRLTYKGKTHTPADDTGDIHTYAMPHYQRNIIDSSNMTGTERICISKRIVGCKSQLTICDDGEECCTLKANQCKYISQ
ncbi:MAG: hypothetical protein KAH93_06250 [Candidatus Aenigmarchaeota archaeon]|nr:hypothetical protein [Candidatus Aenigmarchaeota archaeon]